MEDQKEGLSRKITQYTYYILIGIISLVVVVFLPMLGSDTGLAWDFPTTPSGWSVFVVSRLAVSFLNVLIFTSFMNQGKLNIKDDPNYKRANDILMRTKKKAEEVPKSPRKWYVKQYSKKGLSIFLGSGLCVVAFTQAILQYNLPTLLTYGTTLIMGLVFGVMQMKKTESYWTEEFLRYAIMIEKSESAEKVEESVNNNTEGEKKC